MIPPQLRRDWPRNAALLTTLGVLLFSALTVIFVDLLAGTSRAGVGADDVAVPPLRPMEHAAGPATDSAAVASPHDTAGDPPALSLPSAADMTAGGERIAPVDQGSVVLERPGLELRRDAAAGFEYQLPLSWLDTRVEGPGTEDHSRADYDLVHESPDGDQRIALSVWHAAERAPFSAWVMSVAGGMRPLGDGFPTNGYIAGIPALVVGEPESPTTPVRYAVFLEHQGRYVRIAWSSRAGTASVTDFLRVLATFNWPDQTSFGTSTTTEGTGANQAPLLDLPAGFYFPSGSLFSDNTDN